MNHFKYLVSNEISLERLVILLKLELYIFFIIFYIRDDNCTKEIRASIANVKAIFTKNNKLNLKPRRKLLKCYVWSIAQWTLLITKKNYLASFDMWYKVRTRRCCKESASKASATRHHQRKNGRSAGNGMNKNTAN